MEITSNSKQETLEVSGKMSWQKFRVTKDFLLCGLLIEEGETIELDQYRGDGTYWSYKGHIGCPFIEYDYVEEIKNE